jgi:hypothetical protein
VTVVVRRASGADVGALGRLAHQAYARYVPRAGRVWVAIGDDEVVVGTSATTADAGYTQMRRAEQERYHRVFFTKTL